MKESEVLDLREMHEWLDRVMPFGVDIQEQYEYFNAQKDSHPKDWNSNVEMETDKYTRERN